MILTYTQFAMTMKRILILLLGALSTGFAQTFNESGGLVVMEMESTASPLGLWEKQSALAGAFSNMVVGT